VSAKVDEHHRIGCYRIQLVSLDPVTVAAGNKRRAPSETKLVNDCLKVTNGFGTGLLDLFYKKGLETKPT